MNDFQFVSSLVSSLAWPLVLIVLVVIFRKQVGDLIGRIRSFKGMGQEITFGDRLADAENSVEEAVRSASIDKGEAQQIETESSPLARDADANPSFVIIRSWEQIVSAINNLADIALPGMFVPSRSPSSTVLRELRTAELVSPETEMAIRELRELRNRVAHGEHNPTAGEAVAYAEAAQRISTIMKSTTAIRAKGAE